MSIKINRPLYLAAAVLMGAIPIQAQDTCSEILRDGVFNSSQVFEGALASLSYRAWECTAEFRNHNDAINAGVRVGFPVFDVPIEVGGTWAESHVSNWKRTNCSESDLNSTSERTTITLIRTVAPELTAAWVRCRELTRPDSAIACEVTQQGNIVVFNARWIRTPGDQNAPKVTYYDAFDAQCSRRLDIGEEFTDAGVSVPCLLLPDRDPSFVLNSTRGSCSTAHEVQRPKRIFAGKTVLSAAEFIEASEVTFEPGAVVVTNGWAFTINTRKLEVRGGVARIAAFDARDGRPAGEAGRSAAPITIVARNFTGTALEIDNSGESGMAGQNGVNGQKGSKGGQGRQHDWDPFSGCHGRTESGPGGQGTPGTDAGSGGRAGDGGNVTIQVCGVTQTDPLQRIRIATLKGGQRGVGGQGGAGGPGGDGGDAVPGTTWCGGGPPGPPGPPGPRGRDGATPDRDGTDGTLFWIPCSS